jgi:hypothetical protein
MDEGFPGNLEHVEHTLRLSVLCQKAILLRIAPAGGAGLVDLTKNKNRRRRDGI